MAPSVSLNASLEGGQVTSLQSPLPSPPPTHHPPITPSPSVPVPQRTAYSRRTEQGKRTAGKSEQVRPDERLNANTDEGARVKVCEGTEKRKRRGGEEKEAGSNFHHCGQQPCRSPQTGPPTVSPVRSTLSVPEDLQESRSLLTLRSIHTHTHSLLGGHVTTLASLIDMGRRLLSEQVSPESAPRAPG